MILSSKTQNSLKILLHVASEARYGRLSQGKEIALKQRINEPYLEQIMISLKQGGLVRTVRGRNGGYTLARAPEGVSLLDVIRVCEGHIDFSGTEAGKKGVGCEVGGVIKCMLREVEDAFCAIAAKYSLASMVEKYDASSPEYII